MTTSERRMLELALLGLETERARIEGEILQISRRLKGARPARTSSPGAQAGPPNKGKPMSAAQKKLISQRMKALWAKRRRAKTA